MSRPKRAVVAADQPSDALLRALRSVAYIDTHSPAEEALSLVSCPTGLRFVVRERAKDGREIQIPYDFASAEDAARLRGAVMAQLRERASENYQHRPAEIRCDGAILCKGSYKDMSDLYRKLIGKDHDGPKQYQAFRRSFALARGVSAPPSGRLQLMESQPLRVGVDGEVVFNDPRTDGGWYDKYIGPEGQELHGGRSFMSPYRWRNPAADNRPGMDGPPINEDLLRQAGRLLPGYLYLLDHDRHYVAREVRRVGPGVLYVPPAAPDAYGVAEGGRLYRYEAPRERDPAADSWNRAHMMTFSWTDFTGKVQAGGSANTSAALRDFLNHERLYPSSIPEFPAVAFNRESGEEVIVTHHDPVTGDYAVTTAQGDFMQPGRDLFENFRIPQIEQLRAELEAAEAQQVAARKSTCKQGVGAAPTPQVEV